MTYESNCTLDKIAEMLRQAQRVMITTHAKPDGDALGSLVALGEALKQMGKPVQRWVMPPVPGNLRLLSDEVELVEIGDAGPDENAAEPDCIVVLDTGAWSQIEPLHGYLAARHERVIVIDHHLRGDEVGAAMYVDGKAAACCQIVADLIDLLPVEWNALICRALFVGLASDTGWFRFSNTTAETHELAARLLRCGVGHAELYSQLEQGERPEKLRLLIRALDSLRLVNAGKAAVMTLRVSDFADTGAMPEETERFVDVPQAVRNVRLVALITEQSDGPVRLSFRSKPGPGAINVSQLAQQFGGGGHARAAGAKFDGTLEEAERKVTAALESLDVR